MQRWAGSVGAFIFCALVAAPRQDYAENLSPEIARMMEAALQDAENFRQELRKSQYEAKMVVHEWDGSGRL
ncbi:MAG TPA: hypothetical protein VGH00_00235, partial [Chthoniobacterales bacterium]